MEIDGDGCHDMFSFRFPQKIRDERNKGRETGDRVRDGALQHSTSLVGV